MTDVTKETHVSADVPATTIEAPPFIAPAIPVAEVTKKQHNPQMENLIRTAEKSNADIHLHNNKKIDFDTTTMETSIDNPLHKYLSCWSAKVMLILKSNGMDTQQAERAHKLLMEL